MKERPILMKGEMVRAILDGTKTQTRRIVKPGPPPCQTNVDAMYRYRHGWRYTGVDYDCDRTLEIPPQGISGDRLWCRETFTDSVYKNPEKNRESIVYRADDNHGIEDISEAIWKPSIFMPRWASRITLEITRIRAERVQDISEEDACSEGAPKDCKYVGMCNSSRCAEGHYRRGFRKLWDSINEKRGFSWASNPWVWVIEFKKI